MVKNVILLLLVVLVLNAYCKNLANNNDTLSFKSGSLQFTVNLVNWDFSVKSLNTSFQLKQVDEPWGKLGFGKWVGIEIPIYEGYLTRIGALEYWHHSTSVSQWTLNDTSAMFVINTSDHKRNIIAEITNFRGNQFDFKARVVQDGKASPEINRIGMGFYTRDNSDVREGFYGFGERFNIDNQRGKDLACYTEDGGWALGVFQNITDKYRFPGGESSTYIPMPYFISSYGYGVELHTSYRSYFDMAKYHDNAYLFQVETNEMEFTVYGYDKPIHTLQSFTAKHGRSLIPPKWTFGPWSQLSGEFPGVIRDPYTAALKFLELDIPVSLSIDMVHFLPVQGQKGIETALAELNKKMHSLGIHQTCYFNGYISSDQQIYSYAKNKSYFVTHIDNPKEPYQFHYVGAKLFNVAQVDFTNSEAVTWYQSLLKEAVDLGFSGWMYDYGEYTPTKSLFSNGKDGYEMHNKYPYIYQKACFDFFMQYDKNRSDAYAPDYLFYVRSGYTGSQSVTWGQWTGDPSSDFSLASGLGAQIAGSLNVGLSGMPFSGSDIGGFEWWLESPPTLDLWCRWTQLGAFSGFMHDQTGGNGMGKKTHILDTPEGVKCWRRYSKIRTALFPYIYQAAHEAHFEGLPIMRHHLIHFPDDPIAIQQTYQYMFGGSILVAPVIMPNASSQRVYLPKGNNLWYDLSSGMEYQESDGRVLIGQKGVYSGGQFVDVTAPSDVIPLFVKSGSIVQTLDPSVFSLGSYASNSTIRTLGSMKHMVHLWVFPSQDGVAYFENTFDRQKFIYSSGKLTIENLSETKIVVIAQILTGPVSKVYGNSSGELKSVDNWRDLISTNIAGQSSSWFYDNNLKSCIVRMQPEDTAIVIE